LLLIFLRHASKLGGGLWQSTAAGLSNANLRQFNQILARLLLHEFPSAREDNKWMLDNEFDLPQLPRPLFLNLIAGILLLLYFLSQ
jgi:hypothetical protein